MTGAVVQRAMGLIGGTTQGTISASHANSFRVTAVVERLSMHFRPGHRFEPGEFFTLCLSLARGIDYAIANNDIPPRAQELPSLLKQVYHRKSEPQLQAAVMVLMISVKNACKSGWFLVQDADELLTLANEIGRSFCSPADINIEPSSLPHVISNVMSRFFPRWMIGHVLASLEVKPGFGAFAVDFHILRDKVSATHEKIRLFVIQTDGMLSSSCLISPPKVNFLLNGKGVDRRIDTAMEAGPQLPTNVTTMLKYGTNLLQAIGQFDGNYLIAIAFMTQITSPDEPALEDYVQPVAASPESDSDVIEGSSRISLNCPISFTRIKTPVKGQLCKHRQCFDFENYISINSRRPSWRCPHCNQSVCYVDIRIDQNIVKILREVAGNVADVVVSADGSWKPVMESANRIDEHHDRYNQDGSERCQSTKFSNTLSNVVDLTMEDTEENDTMGTCEIEDTKPSKESLLGLPVSSGVSNTSEVNENLFSRVEDDFWSGVFFPCSSNFNSSAAPSISDSPATNFTMIPVLTDPVPPTYNRGLMDVNGANQTSSLVTQNHTFAPNNLHLQPFHVENSIVTTDFGRSVPRYVQRNPIAVQALPAQSQTPAPHNRLRLNHNSLMSNGNSVASQSPTTDSLINSESERQHQFSRALNSPSVLDTSSPSMHHYSMAQSQGWDSQGRHYMSSPVHVVGLPAPTQAPSSYRASSGLPSERHHLPPQTISQGAAGQNRPSPVARSPPAVPVRLQAPPRVAPLFPMNTDGLRTSIGEQRSTNMVPIISRVDVPNVPPLEQNWTPTGRMRGSLSGRAYSAALNQYLILPTHSTQAATPIPDLSSSRSVPPPHLRPGQTRQ